MKKITPISRTDIVQQIQNKFGGGAAKSYDSGEQTLGDILRQALLNRGAEIPMPKQQTISLEEMKHRILDGMVGRAKVERVTPRSSEDGYFKRDPDAGTHITKLPELTGGKVNYYLVKVDHPQRDEQPAYQAECEDIIRALGMNFDEGCLFKALWRSVNARNGNGKPGLLPVYDAEKMVHYATRILNHARNTNNG